MLFLEIPRVTLRACVLERVAREAGAFIQHGQSHVGASFEQWQR